MTFWRNYYHLVWATHKRLPLITPDIEARLYTYMVSKAAEMEVFVYAINGGSDHVHLIVAIPPKHSVATVVKNLKGASSHYVNHTLVPPEIFNWQRGYGSLTVGERQRPIAEAYVRNQKQHHAEDTAHTWLERCQEEDEGPSDIQKPVTGANVHEPRSDYAGDEPPF